MIKSALHPYNELFLTITEVNFNENELNNNDRIRILHSGHSKQFPGLKGILCGKGYSTMSSNILWPLLFWLKKYDQGQ